jgi:capsular polysaccharide transport system permease protein
MLYRPTKTESETTLAAKIAPAVRRHWPFHLTVVLPAILTFLYLFLFAADQYASEAQYIVRSPQAASAPSLMGDVLGAVSQRASNETTGVAAYLQSHDAVRALSKEVDLVKVFGKPKLDFLNRLGGDPTAEDLLKYYKKRVKVTLNVNTGLSTLEVRAFTPQDSQVIANKLLTLAELQVNRLAGPAQSDATSLAEQEVAKAKQRTIDIGEKLTTFRNQQQALDPAASSEMVMGVLGSLETELATALAERNQAAQYLRPGAPKLKELDNKVASLRGQVALQRGRLTGGSGSLAPTAAGYDRLMLDREFASRDYASALQALEAARLDAAKKHLYLVRVVQPNRPEESLYPRRWLILLSTVISLLVIYGIGWLIIAGIRDHAA